MGDERAPCATSPLPHLRVPVRLRGRLQRLRTQVAQARPTTRALLWSAGAGVVFSLLNALLRELAQQLHPLQAQFLRYFFSLAVMLPLVWRAGLAAYRPRRIGGQFLRGAVHAVGLVLWFTALPRIPLADMTAIGFTAPLFIMLGAWLFLAEPMRWERWLATGIGFAGMLVMLAPAVLVAGVQAGRWHLLMLVSAPVFAASFLLTKALTRTERTEVIVLWQALTVTLFSIPLAWPVWQWPSTWQWLGFVAAGLLGSMGHYALTRSYHEADISATQTVKFLDLVWAALLGLALSGDVPGAPTLAGGAIISLATLWLVRRESRGA
ncbi:MAG: DMT family transporter [Rubrivivax sp.]|nr:DMT family transporter [Rubrivivax sp.]